jgi:hypothetical protein
MGWWYWLDVKEILLDHETLNALGLAQSLTIEMWVHWIHLNNLEIKCIGRLEPALFCNATTPAIAFPPNSPSSHRSSMIS